ncbi:alpha/beta hydrolase [Streptomyces sp. NPDC051907]|uniref:alpha/beta fold hydrolase n=1 Tax=Streptomyces sp. NPDC051907 TaxID=3155284 RepID=UPI00343108B3
MSVYRSAAGREAVRRWCVDQLAAWQVPHECEVFDAGGLTGLRLTPGVLCASAAWLAVPGPRQSAWLLRTMYGTGGTPRPALVDWMTLVARHARSSGAPGLARVPSRSVPRRVVTGEHDVFLPPRRLRAAVRHKLGVELGVVEGAGHLVTEEAPDRLADLVGRVAG